MHRFWRFAISAIVSVFLLSTFAFTATPPSGSVSQATPKASWIGPFMAPTASATCAGASDPACDHFTFVFTAPDASFGPYQIEVLVTPEALGDWDLTLYRADGSVADTSGNASGQPERMILINPPAGTYTVSAAPYAPTMGTNTNSYSGSVELKKYTPAVGIPGTEPVNYAVYSATGGLGRGAGEPTCGANWNTGKVMYQAGTQTLRISFDDCTSPATAKWENKSAPTSVITMDPLLFTDNITGMSITSHLVTPAAAHGLGVLTAACSLSSTTMDDGETWIPSEGCGTVSGADHQGIGGGRYAAPLTRPYGTPVYPHAVYYCAQSGVTAYCNRSDDGGRTFGPGIPAWNLTQCGGLHGHPKVAPNDGTVYIPNFGCNGEQAVVVSEDNGLTWAVRPVPGSSPPASFGDPSIGIATDGTVYFGYTDGDGHAKVAVSRDKGRTWNNIRDAGAAFGVVGSVFAATVAGDPDRAAFAFLGTTTSGDYQAADFPGVWHLYIAHTYDGGDTWTTVNATPNDPVQRGCIWMQGGSNPCRNLLDFMDAEIDRDGRVIVPFADGCIGECATKGPNSFTELASIARQSNGRRMFASKDANSTPAAPALSAAFNTCAGIPSSVRLSWSTPEDNGSAITGYKIYRRSGEGQWNLIATVGAGVNNYEDSSIDPNQSYTYKVSAVNARGEGAQCGEIAPKCENVVIENACRLPGKTMLTDATGDATGGNPAHDVERLSLAEPESFGPGKVIFQLKVVSLASLPANTTWPVVFNSGGADRWARMSTNALGAVSFAYGTGINPSAFNSAGTPADPASSYNADGTINIVVPRSALSVEPGGAISQFLTRIRIELPTGGAATPDNMPDGLARTGVYDVVGSENCAGSPPVARDDQATTTENMPVVIDVLSNDSDGGAAPITVVSIGQPSAGTTVNNGDGTVTYRPSQGFVGNDSFTYTIRNAQGLTATGRVSVLVNPGCPLVAKGRFEDSLEPEPKPDWMVDTADNTLAVASPTWQSLTDPNAKSASHSWFSDATTLELKDDRLIMPSVKPSEASQLTFWHRYGFESGYDGGVIEVSTDGGSTWTDVIAGGGSFVQGGYDGIISSNFNSPIAGREAWSGGPNDAILAPMTQVVVNLGAYAGKDALIRFRLAADPFGPGALPGAGWWIDDIVVTNTLVQGACNRAPEANNDLASTIENTAVTVDVLANDVDPDGDAMTVADASQPANGSVTNNGNNVTYTPANGFVGTDSFSYTAADGKGGTATAQVTVTVNQRPNTAPVAGNDAATTEEDKSVSINVLANDSDADGDALSVFATTQPGNGTATFNSSSVTYTPNSGFVGADSFTYTVTDGRGGADDATVNVTVEAAPNRAPVANDDQTATQKNTAVTVNVLANDTDADGDSLTIASATQPANGSVQNNGGNITYTPNQGFSGSDSFTYTASDGRGGSDAATVTVTVSQNATGGGKASGNGWIGNKKTNFSFNASLDGSTTTGRMSYSTEDGSVSLKGAVEQLSLSGNVAVLEGSCTMNGNTPCRFSARAEDNADPGSGADRFSIQIYDALGNLVHSADAVLGGGNVKVQ